MSEYTVVNIIGCGKIQEYHFGKIDTDIFYKNFKDNIVAARYGGDKREEIYDYFIKYGESSKDEIGDTVYNGKLVYSIPVEKNLERNDMIYVVVDKFEDTGGSHEIKIYKVIPFDIVLLEDKLEIYDDDEYGTKVQKKIREKHGIDYKHLGLSYSF